MRSTTSTETARCKLPRRCASNFSSDPTARSASSTKMTCSSSTTQGARKVPRRPHSSPSPPSWSEPPPSLCSEVAPKSNELAPGRATTHAVGKHVLKPMRIQALQRRPVGQAGVRRAGGRARRMSISQRCANGRNWRGWDRNRMWFGPEDPRRRGRGGARRWNSISSSPAVFNL